MKKIIALGLNPALQRTLVFDTVIPGDVNRAVAEYVSPGGKAALFARGAQTLFPGSVTPAYFRGGMAGNELVDGLERLGIHSVDIEVSGETRTCTTVVDQAKCQSTELIGVSGSITQRDADRMKALLMEQLPDVDGLAVCGTYPKGIDEPFFLDLIHAFEDKPVVVDAYRGVNELLGTGRVTLLKINLAEVRALTGVHNLMAGADYCLKTFNLECLMVTDGPRSAHLFMPNHHVQYDLECIEFVNPVGAGDTCAGVMFSAYIHGLSIEQAFSKGLAAAMATCQHYEPASFTVDEMDAMVSRITIRG